MTEHKPTVYIFHGDDEFAITQAVNEIISKIGDPSTAEMDTTHLDGASLNLDELVRATRAMPFLAERRLTVLNDPLKAMKSPKIRERFKEILAGVPESNALIIAIYKPLLDYRARRRGKKHWLEKWAEQQTGRAFVREFSLPKGAQMPRWIQQQAKQRGGAFSLQGAELLGAYIGDNPRLAMQEIEKLLAYVNYQRPVEADDVETVVSYAGETDIFGMVDALGRGDGRTALRLLHHLLEQDEPLRLFGMIIRQFRLLLLTRELLDAGYREAEIASALKTSGFVVRKLTGQVRNFSLPQLEAIYHKLLDVDNNIKTGQIDGDVALDTLVAALTA